MFKQETNTQTNTTKLDYTWGYMTLGMDGSDLEIFTSLICTKVAQNPMIDIALILTVSWAWLVFVATSKLMQLWRLHQFRPMRCQSIDGANQRCSAPAATWSARAGQPEILLCIRVMCVLRIGYVAPKRRRTTLETRRTPPTTKTDDEWWRKVRLAKRWMSSWTAVDRNIASCNRIFASIQHWLFCAHTVLYVYPVCVCPSVFNGFKGHTCSKRSVGFLEAQMEEVWTTRDVSEFVVFLRWASRVIDTSDKQIQICLDSLERVAKCRHQSGEIICIIPKCLLMFVYVRDWLQFWGWPNDKSALTCVQICRNVKRRACIWIPVEHVYNALAHW